MDKNTVIGLVIIVLILVGYSWLNRETEEEFKARVEMEREAFVQDSLARLESNSSVETTNDISPNNSPSEGNTTTRLETIDSAVMPSRTTVDSTVYKLAVATNQNVDPNSDSAYFWSIYDSLYVYNQNQKIAAKANRKYGVFAPANAQQEEAHYFIENDKIKLKLSSKGGQIVEAHVKGYKTYSSYMDSASESTSIQLFDEDSTFQNLLLSPNGTTEFLNTIDLNFVASEINETSIKLRAITANPDKYLEFHYHLDTNYVVNYDINFVGLDQDIDGNKIDFNWDMKGLSTEKLVSQERTICGIFYKCKGDSRDYLGETGPDSENEFGTDIEWVAFKHNYFSSMFFMEEGFDKNNSEIEVRIDASSSKYTKQYLADVSIATQLGSNTQIPLKMYFGPNDFEQLSALDIEANGIINLGPSIFRTVNEWFIIPIFKLLQSTGMGYGMIIILMTLIIKIVILPLTYKNYKSSAKMRILKPEITKINEKYPDKADAMKKQQETMSLYKKSGASPMAGCIPMLIQMPILFAAFRFFPSSMDLRQESFLWAEDLSAYDAIITWDAYIPLLSDIYGNHVSLFTLLMCVSTIFYTKMNSGQMQAGQPGMPNMKVIMYIFPVMMLFFFNKFASGLSLYYLCGNVMNMGLMWGVKKYFIDEDKLQAQMASKSKKPKKQSKFQQRLNEMAKQQQAKQQSRR
ncbi:MAG: membrane protein insertase YidC [Crocinitomicaceae bacterium]|nr:membrane protein insertase YidC [Crocinitomicaceae bacterium]